jgi:hypothetical protein
MINLFSKVQNFKCRGLASAFCSSWHPSGGGEEASVIEQVVEWVVVVAIT